ncbi:MAG: hypothetical protein HXY42_08130 [Chloroflexi bacterium]|nr:hypothetical protein [Chloroflexota bacterium]
MTYSRLVFILALALAACSRPARPKPTPIPPTAPLITATAPTIPTVVPSPAFTPVAAVTIACSELGGAWTGGMAAMRPDGSAYDVSACERPLPMRQAEMVKPAERDAERWGEARCNDGTPFGFSLQLSPSGQSREWIIYLEGGAFCEDDALDCASRGHRLSSTPDAGDRTFVAMINTGIFNRAAQQNPAFHDANIAFAHYCSSDGWSGATTQKRPTQADPEGWYFSGRANVRAMVEILIQRYGLDDSNPQTRVLFAGSSAGGIGVEVNADTLARLLPRTAADGRLMLVDDGGFIPDFDDPAYRPGEADVPLRELIIAAYDFWGSSLNPLCEAERRQAGEHPGRCFLSAVVYPYLTQPPPDGLGLPVFIQYSSIDEFALNLHGIEDRNDAADAAALERWRANTLASLEGMEWVFSGGARPYHTVLQSDEKMQMGPPGQTFLETLSRFWEGGAPMRIIFGNP